MMRILYFLFFLASSSAFAERMPITDIRPLLVAAITSPDGTAKGVMVGEVVKVMQVMGRSFSPIEVDVSTVASLDQFGCKRLRVTTRQKGVMEPAKALPEDKQLVYQVNFCADGSFPKIGK